MGKNTDKECIEDGCERPTVSYRKYCSEHFLAKYGDDKQTLTIVLLDEILKALKK